MNSYFMVHAVCLVNQFQDGIDCKQSNFDIYSIKYHQFYSSKLRQVLRNALGKKLSQCVWLTTVKQRQQSVN